MLLFNSAAFSVEVPISLFPLENYDQNIETWLAPNNANFDLPLADTKMQQEKVKDFYKRFYATSEGSLSPWHASYVNGLFQEKQSIAELEKILLDSFNNETKDRSVEGYQDTLRPYAAGFGENFRPYTQTWIQAIEDNIHLAQYQSQQQFNSKKRGILIQNTSARVLPTEDPYFYHFTIAGEGYPFDNLQLPTLYAGTPVYCIGQTVDSAWTLVLCPYFIGWIPSNTIALANDAFIQNWQSYAQKNLVAITHTETPIIDSKNKQFQFKSYVGSFFPLASEQEQNFKIVIPQKDIKGQAVISFALVDKENAVKMPLPATRHNFSHVIKTLQNRPYGWGGMYFYNDCALELKNLFVPFGFYLPMHSSNQIYAGKAFDKSKATPKERLEYLLNEAPPLMSIVYTEGHVFLYVDKYDNAFQPESSQKMIMTYQNKWGLKPKDGSRRAVLGKALFLPLLETYPEDPTLDSLINAKIFKIIHLNAFSEEPNNRVAQPKLKNLMGVDS